MQNAEFSFAPLPNINCIAIKKKFYETRETINYLDIKMKTFKIDKTIIFQ